MDKNKPNKRKKLRGRKRFLGRLLVLLLNIMALLVCGLYLLKTPIFQSQMAIVLPGKGSQSNVKLENVGQVSSSSSSPFSQRFNPRANYKSILQSNDVAEKVMQQLDLQNRPQAPKIKLIQQTSIIEISIRSEQAQHSQELSWAYFNALKERLSELREDELDRRQYSTRKALSVQSRSLNDARQQLLDFQQRALLIDKKMMDEHMNLLADVRAKRTNLKAQASRLIFEVDRLSKDLGVSPFLAARALNLQSDIRFNVYLEELSIVSAEYNEQRSVLGKNHPKMKTVQQRYTTARANIRKRSREIAGEYSAELLQNTNLANSQQLATLFAKLLQDNAQLEGVNAELSQLDLIHSRLTDELKVLSREAAELERLQREQQRYEAVYNSAAARLQLNQTDIYSSYPIVQLLAAPSAPVKAISPSPFIAALAAIVSLLFINFGAIVLWKRKAIVAFILKKS